MAEVQRARRGRERETRAIAHKRATGVQSCTTAADAADALDGAARYADRVGEQGQESVGPVGCEWVERETEMGREFLM